MADLTTNITAIVGVVQQIIALFSVFPINILVAGMVAGVGFGFLRKTKKVAQ